MPRLILIVEDDADLSAALAETLVERGYEVATAGNGRDGLRRMREVRPDAVVLDLLMPQMDGWQFRLEQKRDPQLSGVPVIAISASRSAAAATMDADLYLEKPFPPERIAGAIETVLRERARAQGVVTSVQHERLVALGTLAAGIAHEINNPLTYVLLNLSGALRHLATVDSEPHRAELDRIDRMMRDAIEGAERIGGVVQGIRLFSRADERAAEPLDLRASLDAALRLVMNELRMRARLVTDYGQIPPVLGDEVRLGQVFLNLLTNAIHAIPAGDPSLQHIRVATLTDDDGRAIVEITDTGSGIPESLRTRIFEPFFTTKPVGHGTGLGLPISYGIVRGMGGEITVTSEVGRGSTFRVALPSLERVHRNGVVGEGPGVPRDRLRVLVADDEPAICAAISQVLGVEHDVVEASSAREALDRLTANQGYDVLLFDVQMPGMSGVELYRCVRAIWPELGATIVLMTGGTLPHDVRDLLAADDVTVLDKPLDLLRLRSLLAPLTRTAG